MPSLGHRRDPAKAPGEKADFDARSRFGAARIAPRSDNLRLIGSVLNQGAKSSCVAHAVLQAVRGSHIRQGVDQPALGSRLMLYYLARAQLAETDVDAGTFIRLAFQSLNKFGFCPETLWPYTDQGDAWKTKPSLEAFRSAYDQRSATPRPTSYYKIFDTGFDRVAAVKMALSAGYLVAFGTAVSKAFCANDLGVGPLSAPVDKELAGLHAMTIVDHEGDVFRTVNSWGEEWGERGFWHARADYIAWPESDDFWVCEAAPYYSGGVA